MQRQSLIIAIHLMAWLFTAVVSTFLFSGILPFTYAALSSFVNVGLVIVVYYLNVRLADRLIEKKAYWLYITWFVGALILFTSVRMYFNYVFILPHATPVYAGPVGRLSLFALSTTLLALLMSLFYGLFTNRNRKEKEYLKIISEAQLKFLKAQMNPHFLFNTLNNIYSLTLSNSVKASEMILLLSDLLRYAVYDGKEKQVTLSREIKQINNYIKLFQMKSETPLHITFKSLDQNSNFSIEPMILIPLVENCFKHCDFDTNVNAFATISLEVIRDSSDSSTKIFFTTENSVNKNHPVNSDSGGVGLANIRQRLQIRYQQNHTFEVSSDETIFRTKLTIDTNE